jgi:hypothetical protein
MRDLKLWQIDYFVAKAKVIDTKFNEGMGYYVLYKPKSIWEPYSPTSIWSQGGPIIEKEKINLEFKYDIWKACINKNVISKGETALEAAMRCYVALKLGNDVSI